MDTVTPILATFGSHLDKFHRFPNSRVVFSVFNVPDPNPSIEVTGMLKLLMEDQFSISDLAFETVYYPTETTTKELPPFLPIPRTQAAINGTTKLLCKEASAKLGEATYFRNYQKGFGMKLDININITDG